jgi:outer membrane protein TolC
VARVIGRLAPSLFVIVLLSGSTQGQTLQFSGQAAQSERIDGITGDATPVQQPASLAPVASLSLNELIREALARNPAIKVAEHQVQAMRAQVPQVRSLPDPVVSVGWMGNITPFSVQHGDPSSYRGISAMQMIPFPGKLALRGRVADREAEAASWNIENVRREIVSEVKVAYYNYFYNEKALEITQKDKDLLQKLESISEALYRVGKGTQQDPLRAQVEVSRLLQRITVLEQEERTATVRVNTLLDRDPEAPLPPAAPFETAAFTYTLEDLYSMASQRDPGLQYERRMIERSQDAVNLARLDYAPDFQVSYDYEQRPGMPDMHGFMVGINIPVFYKTKQREAVIEKTEQMTSVRHQLDDRQTTVNFGVKEQYLAAKAARDLMNLYSGAVVPQSSLALEASMSSYEVGKVDFLTMLTNFTTVLDYEVDYYRELTNFQIALARLEPMVGIELTR